MENKAEQNYKHAFAVDGEASESEDETNNLTTISHHPKFDKNVKSTFQVQLADINSLFWNSLNKILLNNAMQASNNFMKLDPILIQSLVKLQSVSHTLQRIILNTKTSLNSLENILPDNIVPVFN